MASAAERSALLSPQPEASRRTSLDASLDVSPVVSPGDPEGLGARPVRRILEANSAAKLASLWLLGDLAGFLRALWLRQRRQAAEEKDAARGEGQAGPSTDLIASRSSPGGSPGHASQRADPTTPARLAPGLSFSPAGSFASLAEVRKEVRGALHAFVRERLPFLVAESANVLPATPSPGRTAHSGRPAGEPWGVKRARPTNPLEDDAGGEASANDERLWKRQNMQTRKDRNPLDEDDENEADVPKGDEEGDAGEAKAGPRSAEGLPLAPNPFEGFLATNLSQQIEIISRTIDARLMSSRLASEGQPQSLEANGLGGEAGDTQAQPPLAPEEREERKKAEERNERKETGGGLTASSPAGAAADLFPFISLGACWAQQRRELLCLKKEIEDEDAKDGEGEGDGEDDWRGGAPQGGVARPEGALERLERKKERSCWVSLLEEAANTPPGVVLKLTPRPSCMRFLFPPVPFKCMDSARPALSAGAAEAARGGGEREEDRRRQPASCREGVSREERRACREEINAVFFRGANTEKTSSKVTLKGRETHLFTRLASHPALFDLLFDPFRSSGGATNYVAASPGYRAGAYETRWPANAGAYVHFVLMKINRDTSNALHSVGRGLRRHPQKSLAVAGTKDKRGITVQRCSILKVSPSALLAACYLDHPAWDANVHIAPLGYFSRPQRLGGLLGNSFQVVLRNVRLPGPARRGLRGAGPSGDLPAARVAVALADRCLPLAQCDAAIQELARRVEAGVATISSRGFLNYFGLQRFGTHAVRTFEVGAALLRGDWKEAVALILGKRARRCPARHLRFSAACPAAAPGPTRQEQVGEHAGWTFERGEVSLWDVLEMTDDPRLALARAARHQHIERSLLSSLLMSARKGEKRQAAREAGNRHARDDAIGDAGERKLPPRGEADGQQDSGADNAEVDMGEGEQRESREGRRSRGDTEKQGEKRDMHVKISAEHGPADGSDKPSSLDALSRFDVKDYFRALQEIPPNSLQLYVHSAQSVLFNHACSWRWQTFGDKVCVGDIVRIRSKDGHAGGRREKTDTMCESGEGMGRSRRPERGVWGGDQGDEESDCEMDDFRQSVRVIETEAEACKASIFDVVLPMPGADMTYPSQLAAVYAQLAVDLLGVSLDVFNTSKERHDSDVGRFRGLSRDAERGQPCRGERKRERGGRQRSRFEGVSRRGRGRGRHEDGRQGWQASSADSAGEKDEDGGEDSEDPLSLSAATGLSILGVKCSGSYRPLLERARNCQWQLLQVSEEAVQKPESVLLSDVDLLLRKQRDMASGSAERHARTLEQKQQDTLEGRCGQIKDAEETSAVQGRDGRSENTETGPFRSTAGAEDLRVSWDEPLDPAQVRCMFSGGPAQAQGGPRETEAQHTKGASASEADRRGHLFVAGETSNICLLLRLRLTPGTYFTMALRELMKSNAPDDDELAHAAARTVVSPDFLEKDTYSSVQGLSA
ncbi:hypothetical protein BESB_000070 [Besnoitia besnoiti]|uniref:TRUD domain-containing protein n=1 Tax=Besnoitia besnoiti TaxID=94643 RepID=A0A2A9MI57_BESBE|nr:hypothetical protein BESB_000070 [Besnoitia besnoiti]PFH37665.1 hypothetical protein BESB_000070 [Besnoitia besnoiti]